MNDAIKMQISAFVDGELPQNEAELLLRRLCQDREFRQQASEYLAMGRVMRGERSVAGLASLRERIAAELDETGFEESEAGAPPSTSRFVRPLAGVAIAASVALVALLGLQQVSVEPESEGQGTDVVADALDTTYTVPDSSEDLLRDYRRIHNRSSSYIGAPSLSSELVRYEVSEELLPESSDDAESEAPAETPAP